MKLSKIVFVLLVFFLVSDIANATSFDDLINNRLQGQTEQAEAERQEALRLDLKVGVGAIMNATSLSYYDGEFRLEEYQGITPRFEVNAIYFISRYIGVGLGGDLTSLSFKDRLYNKDGYLLYPDYTAEDMLASVYGIISGRIEKITGYFFVGVHDTIGCGIDYSINNFLVGISYRAVETQVSGIKFGYSSINLSVGYRLDILSLF